MESPPDPAAARSLSRALARVRAGIEIDDGFAELDRLLRPRLAGYFRAHGAPWSDADDLVQKCLARVYRGVSGLRDEASFMPWLFTIARNVRATSHGQRLEEERLRDRDGVPEAIAGDAKSPEDEAIAADRLAAVSRIISALPEQQRQCLLLRVRDDLAYGEIAATLGLSANTVRNHIALARRKLRDEAWISAPEEP